MLTNDERKTLTAVFAKEGISLGTTKTDMVKAISQFQKRYGLQVVGTIGPKTRVEINQRTAHSCVVTDSVSTTTAPTPVIATLTDVDPSKLELLNPNGGEIIEQGFGRTHTILWNSKNIPTDASISVQLIAENLETVIKAWKVENTGKLTLSFNEVDDLPVGWFYVKIKYFCNSDTIACAEDVSDSAFVVYPPSGWVANFFHFDKFKSGEKYYINDSQSLVVNWYTYSKDFDYYKIYLGNVVLGKEVFVGNVQGYSQAIRGYDLRELKKGMTKSDTEIQNAYYVRVQVAKRNPTGGPDKVLKEIITGQFGVR